MKKLFITFLVIVSTLINTSFADYDFSSNEKNQINSVISTLNADIKDKGDMHKKIIVNIIQRIQLRDNLTDKQEAILELLLEGIGYSVEEKTVVIQSEINTIEEDNIDKDTSDEADDSITGEVKIEEKNTNSLFNESEVREYWKDLLNKVREGEGLDGYSYDDSLNSTAKAWSDLAVSRGKITHQVDLGDSYYDYSKKVTWMKKNGVTCKNVNRATFSESIAWQEFNCSSKECTTEVKAAIKRSYDFFVGEKGKDYDLHYKAIVHPYFETMGLGLSIVEKGGNRYKIYLTNHYCTTNIQ